MELLPRTKSREITNHRNGDKVHGLRWLNLVVNNETRTRVRYIDVGFKLVNELNDQISSVRDVRGRRRSFRV